MKMICATNNNLIGMVSDTWFIIVCTFEREFERPGNIEYYWQNYSKKYKTLRRAAQAIVYLRDNNKGWMITQTGSAEPERSRMIFKIVSCIPPISQQERIRLKIYKR